MARSVACFLVVLTAVGCGRRHDQWNRAAVRGRVLLDGAPLAEGTITFFPAEGVQGPAAGGPIRDGTYDLAQHDGPVLGRQRIEIRSVQKTGRTVPSPVAPEADGPVSAGQLVEERIEIVPSVYNSNTTLVREIKPADNELDFELKAAGSRQRTANTTSRDRQQPE